MTYLDDIAGELRRAVPADAMPEEDTERLFRIYAVLVQAKGEHTTASDVHDAWSAWMAEINPQHRSLKPFAQLDREVQDGDVPFLEAIHRVARDRP